MLMIKTEAEYRLMDLLKSLQASRSSWRAQTYRLSQLKDKVDLNSFEKIAFGIINNFMSDYEGSAFFCHDRDIFIVCKSLTKRMVDEVTAELLGHIPENIKKQLSGFSDTFDLGVLYEDFRQLAQQKLSSLNAKIETHGSPVQETLPPMMSPENSLAAIKHASVKGPETKVPDILAARLSRQRTRVLLVEDDAVSLHLAKKSLMLDFDIVTAENGITAQAAYVQYAPDVVFLDIGLPDVTGHDVLRAILKLDPTAYIVMLSGNSYKDEIMKAMQSGAKGFVGKPFSKVKLFQYISQCPTHHAPPAVQ